MPACLLGAGARARTRLFEAARICDWRVSLRLLDMSAAERHNEDGKIAVKSLHSWIFVSGEARFVSRGLPRTEGWNGAAAFDEGRWRRNVKWKPNRLQSALQVKTATRHSSGRTPLGKPPRFVVARSANPICRHIWNSICGIAAMLTNRVFVHKSLGTPPAN